MPERCKPITHRPPTVTSHASPATGRENLTVLVALSLYLATASRNLTNWPPCMASVLNMKTEQASFHIGWIVIATVTEEEFASIAYLKTAAPSVDQLYYHEFLIQSVSVALSVTSSRDKKLLLFYVPVHFHITHKILNEYCDYVVSTLIKCEGGLASLASTAKLPLVCALTLKKFQNIYRSLYQHVVDMMASRLRYELTNYYNEIQCS